VSVTSAGQPASGPVTPFSISANGRFAAFYGPGDGLPGAGANPQVWVHDRKSGRTRLASRSNSGEPGDGFSSVPFLSGGGRFVAFRSDAANLPGSDGTNDYMYVRDLERGKTILISRTTSGEPVPGNCVCQAISADGRFAVFESDDAGLPGGDGNTVHAYRRDLKRNRTTLIDRTTSGEIAEDDSREPSIAGGGRYVVFRSTAANLPGANGEQQLYRRDLNRGQTRLVSRNNRGQAADEGVADGRVSGDGGVVVFSTEALNLPGDGDLSTFQVYARAAGKTRLISKAANGAPGDDDSFYTSISLNGRFATFDSYADNLGGNPDFSNLFRTGPLR
jgi:Tol biopolymer transport system component